MDSALAVHRLHFAFTVTFHYLFPQLTMGLALLIVILKTARPPDRQRALQSAPPASGCKIFAINFAMGVVTGIPMEFQFGTNWARFSKAAGGVIGQTLAMEGVFSFFLESQLSRIVPVRREAARSAGCTGCRRCWSSSARGFRASSSSPPTPGCSIPPATSLGPNGEILLIQLLAVCLLNPWVLWQYLHNMIASVVTASVVMAAIGAYYLLSGNHSSSTARTFVRTGVIAGSSRSSLLLFPTGDGQGKNDRRASTRHPGGHGRACSKPPPAPPSS